MTPKEKAIELVKKMYTSEHCGIKHQPNKNYCECSEINLFQAKQCALIAVNEILNEPDCSHDYWIEVKEEIEKL